MVNNQPKNLYKHKKMANKTNQSEITLKLTIRLILSSLLGANFTNENRGSVVFSRFRYELYLLIRGKSSSVSSRESVKA